MVKIIYKESDGTEHPTDLEPGVSVMQGALNNGVPSILGECGGQLACGTCLVYVDPAWRDKTGEPEEMEEATLELHADNPHEGKRLSCQIKASDELDGLVVHLPDSQY
ncbi:2Fe-2S iron-sulfur cluster binding domain-containing protein [Mangrovimicrobium sediminis]|uniref:2Fe-2S iron-sulfur cluster binding domain-containing protein n=1 Tax=Mangrovimicrobium sediminis TaxID=2562682 RepID=A0A4Z0M1K3_9GAMM|nr:2Fe-2S iron-sulfur cluster-binding protein [Haliea sp. SAOS-164]TGD73314.1 2Fe-2S iron-sulfur cluster binding domain-containing protein [Haliea sp. SAOS-164]